MGHSETDQIPPFAHHLTGDEAEHRGAFLMRAVVRASEELNAEMSRLMLLNDLDMRAMAYLMENGPTTITQLAKRLGISKALASVVVYRLEAVGHGRRERDSKDRRRVFIHPQPHSAEGAMGMLQPVIMASDEAYRSLDDHGRAAVEHFLSATLKSVEARVDDLKRLPTPPKHAATSGDTDA